MTEKAPLRETMQLGDLVPGTRYLGRDGEPEYLITNAQPSEGTTSVVNMRTGELLVVDNSTRLALTQNYRLRVT